MDQAQLDALERLQTAQSKGLISQEEFETERATILGKRPAPPIQRRPAPGPPSMSGGAAWIAFGMLGIIGVVISIVGIVILIGATIGFVAQQPTGGTAGTYYTPPAPQPVFQLTDSKLVDCSSIFDVCYAVQCEVVNVGDAAGNALVTYSITQSGNMTTAEDSKYILPNERMKFYHKFPEARLTGGDVYGNCVLQ